ncbi:hypothetical protein GBAR_LOCUS5629 [Geodia barretti]|uniref:Uncharacterized protein n=1 Tax=Geodia barretti TaxID=519541 RepID=A0AA35RCG7_GEOBA|nr:hypothetical protein GBAR_LOCUS5629 [Geodia barretti]
MEPGMVMGILHMWHGQTMKGCATCMERPSKHNCSMEVVFF